MLKTLNLGNNKLNNIPAAMENLYSLKSLNLKANHMIRILEKVKKLESERLELIL